MKNKFSPELKVGILVLAAILVILYMSFRIGAVGGFRQGSYTVYVLLENAGGLDQRTPVQIAGVDVGRIGSVKLEQYRALRRPPDQKRDSDPEGQPGIRKDPGCPR